LLDSTAAVQALPASSSFSVSHFSPAPMSAPISRPAGEKSPRKAINVCEVKPSKVYARVVKPSRTYHRVNRQALPNLVTGLQGKLALEKAINLALKPGEVKPSKVYARAETE